MGVTSSSQPELGTSSTTARPEGSNGTASRALGVFLERQNVRLVLPSFDPPHNPSRHAGLSLAVQRLGS